MPKRIFTVNRGTWLHAGTRVITAENRAQYGDKRGADDPESVLYDPAIKMMCCLGFVASQCGIPKRLLAGEGMPCGMVLTPLQQTAVKILVSLDNYYTDTPLAQSAQQINDDCNLSNTRREQRLVALFKKHGLQMRFTGTYPSGPVLVKERPKTGLKTGA